MLTDSKLKSLKPKDKNYKVTDRDGMYVVVRPTGRIVFRFDYRFNGKRHTVTIGKYGTDGLSLSDAREKVVEFRRALSNGEKPVVKNKVNENDNAITIAMMVKTHIDNCNNRINTVKGKNNIYKIYISPDKFCHKNISDINFNDVNAFVSRVSSYDICDLYKKAIIGLVKMSCKEAVSKGIEVPDLIFKMGLFNAKPYISRERFLTPREIHQFFGWLQVSDAKYTYYALLMLLLYNGNRKTEITNLRWDELDLDNGIITIPGNRMKKGLELQIYLSKQSIAILRNIEKTEHDKIFFPKAKNSSSYLNRFIYRHREKSGVKDHFTVHDIRRTATTLLYELGYNEDVVEPMLAHKRKGIRSVYDRSRQVKRRRRMAQEWADQVDRWIAGEELDCFEDDELDY